MGSFFTILTQAIRSHYGMNFSLLNKISRGQMKANKISKGHDQNYMQYWNDSSLLSDVKEGGKKPVYLGGYSGT